jgi:hypothetical protein
VEARKRFRANESRSDVLMTAASLLSHSVATCSEGVCSAQLSVTITHKNYRESLTKQLHVVLVTAGFYLKRILISEKAMLHPLNVPR